MRNPLGLEPHRKRWLEQRLYGEYGDPWNGVFMYRDMRIIVSRGDGWEHASVSLPKRCPTWREMDWVRHLVWRPEETVMQLHVPVEAHISFDDYCLHLWRPIGIEIPRPPGWMVGPEKEKVS